MSPRSARDTQCDLIYTKTTTHKNNYSSFLPSFLPGAICHYFVICQGSSPAQVEAIADSVAEFTRINAKEKPIKVNGLGNAQWVAMDYGDVLVHIFLPDLREYYDLEHLWEDAPITRIPDLD